MLCYLFVAMNDLAILLSALLLQILILPSLGYFITSSSGPIYFYGRQATWVEAVLNCQKKDDLGRSWRLATLESCTHIRDACDEIREGGSDEIWMGIRRNSNGTFVRSANEDEYFVNWAKGEPSNGVGEDCVVLLGDTMEWDDVRCDVKRQYLCETINESSSTSEQLPTTLSETLELSESSSLTAVVTSTSPATRSSDTEIGESSSTSEQLPTTLSETLELSKSTSSSLTTAVTSTSPATRSSDTEIGGIDVGTDTLYYIGNSLVTWDEAAFNCHRKGPNWRLASLDSIEDVFGLRPYVRNAGVNLWIGVRRNSFGIFVKIGNQQNDFFNWAAGEPNPVTGENCVELMPWSRKWNNLSCEQKRKYICAYRKTNPSTTAEVLPSSSAPKSSNTETGGDIDIGTGTLYSIERSFATWDEAVSNCQRKGANWHLATLDSREDVIGLYLHIKHSTAVFWIGLHRNLSGTFDRVGNQTSDYFKWAEGEPSNELGKDCVELDMVPMDWKTRNCDYERLYLCASETMKPSTISSLSTAMMLKNPDTASLYIEAGNANDCSATLIIVCVLIVFIFFGILAIFVVKRWPPIPQTSTY